MEKAEAELLEIEAAEGFATESKTSGWVPCHGMCGSCERHFVVLGSQSLGYTSIAVPAGLHFLRLDT